MFISYAEVNDTIIKNGGKSRKTNLIAGVDFGYADYNYIDYKGEVEVSFIVSYCHLYSKICFGIAPGTYYGNIYKSALGLGYTTETNRVLSWNIHGGLILGAPSESQTYGFKGNGLFYLETGVFINPFKSKKLMFGVNGNICKSQYYNVGRRDYYNNVVLKTIYLSVNYKFK